MPERPAGCRREMRERRERGRKGGREREGKGRRDGEEGGEEERRNERRRRELMRPRTNPGRGRYERETGVGGSQAELPERGLSDQRVVRDRKRTVKGAGQTADTGAGLVLRREREEPLRSLTPTPEAHGVGVATAALFPCTPGSRKRSVRASHILTHPHTFGKRSSESSREEGKLQACDTICSKPFQVGRYRFGARRGVEAWEIETYSTSISTELNKAPSHPKTPSFSPCPPTPAQHAVISLFLCVCLFGFLCVYFCASVLFPCSILSSVSLSTPKPLTIPLPP